MIGDQDDVDRRQGQTWKQSSQNTSIPNYDQTNAENAPIHVSRKELWRNRNSKLAKSYFISLVMNGIVIFIVLNVFYIAIRTDFGTHHPFQDVKATHLIVCWPSHLGISYLNRDAMLSRYGAELVGYYDDRNETIRLYLNDSEDVIISNIWWGIFPILYVRGPEAAKVTTRPMVEDISVSRPEDQVCPLSHAVQAFPFTL